jgi:hypothetical protein
MTDNTLPPKTPEQQIREGLQALAKALQEKSELSVSTTVKIMEPENLVESAKNPAIELAKTVMQIDGDRVILLPVISDGAGFTIPKEIMEAHERNVKEAIAYRKELVAMLVDFVKTRRLG